MRRPQHPELYNGQVWAQKDFPCFTVMVLMLAHVDGVLMFCKVGVGDWKTPPLMMTEEDGTWMYSAKDLLKQLRDRKYTETGNGRIEIVAHTTLDCGAEIRSEGIVGNVQSL